MARGSIVVPVHNEADIIVGFLETLREGGVLDDYEVVIACNGCTDRTAELASTIAGVVVAETDEAGKCAGLNLGDAAASWFPRVYLDVDVVVSRAAIDRVVDELERGPALAAAPRLHLDLAGRSWPVRAYYAIWSRLSWATEEMIGSGFYALSEEGRARFGPFPTDVVDDLYVSAHFAPGERRSVADVSFTVPSSATVAEIVQRKTRLLTYNRRTWPHIADLPGRPSGRGGAVRVALTRPWLWPAAVVYGVVAVRADRGARRRMAEQHFVWDGSQRG